AAAQTAYNAGNPANFAILNGTITEGQSHGYSSNPLFLQQLPGLAVNNLHVNDNGMDTEAVNAVYATRTVSIRNSVFTDSIDNISDRMRDFSTLAINSTNAPIFIDGNQILSSPQIGIGVGDNNPQYRVTVTNNTVSPLAVTSNAYAIGIAALQNFEIA